MEEKKMKLTIKKKNVVQYAFVLLVGIVLIFSVVQAFQIQEMKSEIISGQLASKSAPIQSTSAPPVLVRKTSAPSTVGGC